MGFASPRQLLNQITPRERVEWQTYFKVKEEQHEKAREEAKEAAGRKGGARKNGTEKPTDWREIQAIFGARVAGPGRSGPAPTKRGSVRSTKTADT